MFAPLSSSEYTSTHKPSYASASASGRGLQPMHLDVHSSTGLTAYKAGPRRDPLSHERHLQHLGALGMGISPTNPYTKNTFGPAVTVPSGWHGSWETSVGSRSNREGLRASNGGMGGLLGSGAAGAAHPHLGLLGDLAHGPPPASPHYARQASGYTEEERRVFLLTNERARKHADTRWQRTNTLGQYVEVRDMPSPRGAPSSAGSCCRSFLGGSGSMGGSMAGGYNAGYNAGYNVAPGGGGGYGGYGAAPPSTASQLTTPMHQSTSLATPAAPSRSGHRVTFA